LIILLKKYKNINNLIKEEAKLYHISVNEYDINKFIEINLLLKNELHQFYKSQNLNEEDIIIKELNNEINQLKEKLSRYPLELSKGEKLISIIFTSSDENMFYSIICKNTQKFTELETKLYNEYPEYSKSNNYFLINGNIVDKDKSLDENKIRNHDIILLNQDII